MGRKKARDNAFKCIYQMEVDKKYEIDNILKYCYSENENDEEEKEYIAMSLNGVIDNLEEIDNIILSKLRNWTISRIAKIDMAILRLAIFEIKYLKDIPVKVSANEAVELAKTYGSSDSKSFVNGVIAQVIGSSDSNE
ncbi:MAG: transcription antitermination factor NusB [Clostridia bacterium]